MFLFSESRARTDLLIRANIFFSQVKFLCFKACVAGALNQVIFGNILFIPEVYTTNSFDKNM